MTKKINLAGGGSVSNSRPQSIAKSLEVSKASRLHPVCRGLPLNTPCWKCEERKKLWPWPEDEQLTCPPGHCKKEVD